MILARLFLVFHVSLESYYRTIDPEKSALCIIFDADQESGH